MILTVIIIPEPNVAYKVINLIMFEFFTFLAFSAHLRTMFTDPVGLVEYKIRSKLNKCYTIGRCSKGDGNKGSDRTIGPYRWSSIVQMYEMLFDQTGTCSPLFRMSTMHT